MILSARPPSGVAGGGCVLPLASVILTGVVVGRSTPVLHHMVAPIHTAVLTEEFAGCAGRHGLVLLS